VGKEGGKIYEGKCKKLWNACSAGEEEKKGGGWARCAIAKVKCMRDGVKVLDGRCGAAWEKCGEEVRAHSGEKKEIDAMAEAKGDGEAAKARKERTEAPKVEALETLVV